MNGPGAAPLVPAAAHAYHDAVETEARRWLRQAEADLASERDSARAAHFEWACFQSQQAAEKALKAVLYERGQRAILTHSVLELVRLAGRCAPALAELERGARLLDQFYIPTRYPSGLPGESVPAEFYGRDEAEACTSSAESILSAVRSTFGG